MFAPCFPDPLPLTKPTSAISPPRGNHACSLVCALLAHFLHFTPVCKCAWITAGATWGLCLKFTQMERLFFSPQVTHKAPLLSPAVQCSVVRTCRTSYSSCTLLLHRAESGQENGGAPRTRRGWTKVGGARESHTLTPSPSSLLRLALQGPSLSLCPGARV